MDEVYGMQPLSSIPRGRRQSKRGCEHRTPCRMVTGASSSLLVYAIKAAALVRHHGIVNHPGHDDGVEPLLWHEQQQ